MRSLYSKKESEDLDENTGETIDNVVTDNNQITDVPVTPCNRICRYNSEFFDGQVCIGCFRETHEISTWASMDASERYWTLLDAMDRMEEVAGNGASFEGAVSKEELILQAKFWEKQQEKC